jgi:Copper binding proteins, plastocyanin/azurin family
MLKQVCGALALACALGCGGGGGGGYSTAPVTPPSGGGNTTPPPDAITVQNDNFSPATKTVAAGSQVSWVWNTCTGDVYTGQTCVAHSVTFDDGVTSATQDKGTFARTFTAPGTYAYHCAVHGAAMTGTITVN